MQNEFSAANSELHPAREIGHDALKVVSVSIFTEFSIGQDGNRTRTPL